MLEQVERTSIHCTLCDQDKPLDNFYPSGQDSETGQCKACVKKRQQDREDQLVAEGKPKRPRKAKKRPLTVNPEQLLESLSGSKANPRLELAAKILEMQQRTIELLVARSK